MRKPSDSRQHHHDRTRPKPQAESHSSCLRGNTGCATSQTEALRFRIVTQVGTLRAAEKLLLTHVQCLR